MKILCIGLVSYDITLPLEDYPIENTKNRIVSKVECGGGQASNAACLLGKFGEQVYMAGLIGNDDYGKKILSEFKQFNVNTDYIEIKDDYTTAVAHILVNLKNGSRTTITVRDDTQRSKNMISLKPEIILFDGQEENITREIISENKAAIKIIDAGSYREPIVSLCDLADIIICSLDFLKGFCGKTELKYNELQQAFMDMTNYYHKTLIVTLGEKGTMALIDNKPTIIPTIKEETKDTTGAGDIFHGAFIYGLIHGMNLSENIRFSNIAGALSVSKIGARNSLPNLDEVLKKYEECK